MTQSPVAEKARSDTPPGLARLTIDTPCWELSVDDDDARKVAPQELVVMLEQLFLIRSFEERLLELAADGILHGPAHASIGASFTLSPIATTVARFLALRQVFGRQR